MNADCQPLVILWSLTANQYLPVNNKRKEKKRRKAADCEWSLKAEPRLFHEVFHAGLGLFFLERFLFYPLCLAFTLVSNYFQGSKGQGEHRDPSVPKSWTWTPLDLLLSFHSQQTSVWLFSPGAQSRQTEVNKITSNRTIYAMLLTEFYVLSEILHTQTEVKH